MDRKEMAALDLRFMVHELREALDGARVKKIYQYGKKEFLFEFHRSGAGAQWLHIDQGKVFLTDSKPESPAEPPSFCMFLRKHLMGKTVRTVNQYLFDRILEIRFLDFILVIELIPPGNLILCDVDFTIIMPLEIQKWKDRVIKPKTMYQHPPLQRDPFDLSLQELQRVLQVDKSLGAVLATTLGLGGLYAEEVCRRAGIDPRATARELNLEATARLHQVLEQLPKQRDPRIYDDMVTPFPLQGKEGKQAETFSQAVDTFFQITSTSEEQEVQETAVDEEKGRLERIIEQQEQAAETLAVAQEERRDKAELLYTHYSLIQGVLNGIKQARDQELSWDEIKEKIQTEDTEEARAIKEIREHDGEVVVDVEGTEITLDFRRSVEENAARFYEGAKHAKQKQARLEHVREETEQQLEDVKPPEPQVPKKKPRAKWYEKYRWFHSSDGFLVVGGKNARQNDMVYKKYCNPGDKAFHADIPGAALVVIQSGGKEVSAEAMKEAAEFSAAHSKAWNKNLGTIDVFMVDPSQVSKTPPSGMALAKGSFMITGERTWYRDTEVKLAIGVVVNRDQGLVKVITGPVFAMRKNATYFITIKPGYKKSLELAQSIHNRLLMRASVEDRPFIEQLSLEELQKAVPTGMGEIVEFG